VSLRDHLVAARIAGDVDTPRENNLRAMRRLADGEERAWFGLAPRPLPFTEVLALMAERAGVHPDPAYGTGPDTIDPDRTLDRLEAMADRLARAARDRERVFLATGHPAGLLAIHLPVAEALRRSGCTLLTPDAGIAVGYLGRSRQLRYLAGVAVLSDVGELNHTHSAVPMRALLDGGLRPDLVVADHGWAGAAGEAGVDTVAFADCNDPALFAGEADGRVAVTVPLDDNVLPHLYEPLARLLVDRVARAGRPNGG
jgi:hypothetical protein